MKRAISLLLMLALFPGVVAAQSGVATKIIQPSPTSVPLSDQDVVDLLRARLTLEEVIAKIRASKCEFDLTPAAVQSLKSAGIPTEVIEVMTQAMESTSANESTAASQRDQKREIIIPAGTPLEIESAGTINSFEVRPGELLSFRVLVSLKIDGVTVIDQDALVTASVVEAKRGGHWGRAGRLSWNLVDVVAVDGTRVPVRGDDVTRSKEPSLADSGAQAGAGGKGKKKNGIVKGDSHSTEIAARTAVMGALLAPAIVVAPFLAPLMLMHGFKRGENAILPAHKRFVVFTGTNTRVKAFPWR